MERTTKKERKENARNFFAVINGANGDRAVIVVERNGGMRTQMKAVPSAAISNPVVIAESNGLGVEGCFYELVESVYGKAVLKNMPGYFQKEFAPWFKELSGWSITYYDGQAFIIERKEKRDS